MSPRHINSLPDLCLRTIFSKLPLEDLLRLDQVCPLWASLAPTVVAQRNTLVILIGEEVRPSDPQYYDSMFEIPYSDQLKPPLKEPQSNMFINKSVEYHWLDSGSAKQLTRLMPNITALSITVCKEPSSRSFGVKSWGLKYVLVDLIISLLRAWSSTLKILKVHLDFFVKTDYGEQDPIEEVEEAIMQANSKVSKDTYRLLGTINTLEVLTHLTFFMPNCIDLSTEHILQSLDLSIISKLSEFNLFTPDYRIFRESIEKYASTNQNLHSLVIYHQRHHEVISQWSDSLAAKITQLPDHCFGGISGLGEFCAKFAKLQRIKVDINNPGQNLGAYVRQMLPLKGLICLELMIYAGEDSLGPEDETNLILGGKLEMPSVRILVLNIIADDPALDQIQWGQFFPNLELYQYRDWNVSDT